MSFLNRLLYPMQQCEDATAHLLGSLNVRYTRSYLQKQLLEHPNYPSLLSIADVIGATYNVACIPLSYTREEILSEPEIAPPFIAHIKTGKAAEVFAVVTEFSNTSIKLYNPDTKKSETLSPEDFDGVYMRTILMARGEKDAGERGYEKNRKEEIRRSVFHNFITFVFPALTLIAFLMTVMANPPAEIIAPLAFMLLTLCGCVVGALLLWHEVDEYNPVLRQICQAGHKVNCSAILNSKASKIFGLSWSSIGFCYFMGMLMILIMAGPANPATLQLLSWINVLALPYIGFSIYYQWKVARQWCLLCLQVQGLLFSQFITAFIGGFHIALPLQQIPPQAYMIIAGAFILLFALLLLLMPALEKAKEGRQRKTDLARLKHNPQVFEALLGRQKTIEKPADNLGITIGNPDGVYKLIKVCNPYCGPCASAHPAMEELVHNNEEVCLQVIFTATDDDADMKKWPVSHLLAIDTKNDKALTQKALDDWYNAPVKDYAVFANKYPLNGELQQQNKKIKEMREWCDKIGLAYTPTFFICLNMANNEKKFYQLPDFYTVDDLRYFFTI